jgi:hypothetical protein
MSSWCQEATSNGGIKRHPYRPLGSYKGIDDIKYEAFENGWFFLRYPRYFGDVLLPSVNKYMFSSFESQTFSNLTKLLHKDSNICDIKLSYYWTTCQDESSDTNLVSYMLLLFSRELVNMNMVWLKTCSKIYTLIWGHRPKKC